MKKLTVGVILALIACLTTSVIGQPPHSAKVEKCVQDGLFLLGLEPSLRPGSQALHAAALKLMEVKGGRTSIVGWILEQSDEKKTPIYIRYINGSLMIDFTSVSDDNSVVNEFVVTILFDGAGRPTRVASGVGVRGTLPK